MSLPGVDVARGALVLDPAGLTQRAPGAQLLGQIPPQRTPVGQVQALVDRLGGHRVVRVVDRQEPADLLRAPLQLELALDEVVQPLIGGELGSPVSFRAPHGVLMCGAGVVVFPVPGAMELSADRGRATPQPTTDLTDPDALGNQGLDPFTLEQREVPAHDRGATAEVTAKATVLPSPPQPGASADADLPARLDRAQP